ncbi:hypothetical protein [Chloracidobacterium aggregatum]|uniref:hypothetical protein n=1 Tax=Chloracidobacterium aggregatum TaxID=2851959 RepID=UPI001B8ACF85|nr:hypothetical protein [Chloracidobacterium aggregatum]QUV95957.1 hypothetical protein J8C00_06345 [Chloracidobacterium sp. E]QUW00898.1 hypothetical protein J8C02_05260 [Chloracidobacterium sp. MS 40/45]
MNYHPLLALALMGGLVTWPVASARADTIRLKNGQTVVGKIVRYENRRFIIVYERASPTTQAIIALEDIESVEFDGRPLPPGYSGSAAPPDTSPPAASVPPPRTTVPPSGSSSGPSGPTTPPATRPPATGGSTGSGTGSPVLTRTVQVIARDDWTYAQLDVRRGDRIRISARGSIRLDNRRQSTPAGIAEDDPEKLMPGRPTGALIAVIGDDNDDYIFIGSTREFVAQRSGKLYLGVNEGDLSDNSGSYEAQVEIQRTP